MLTWFKTQAPIRSKFRALLAILCSLGAASLLATVAAAAAIGPIAVPVTVSALCLVGIFVTIRTAGKLICDPYVDTVLRMEALAAGDTKSLIDYTDYQDCVGRMTKAMATFRDNAMLVQRNSDNQEIIVSALSGALNSLAENRLDCQIDEAFPEEYDALRVDLNKAVTLLGTAMAQVQATATTVETSASEISSAADDLSHRNEQQAASLEETAAALSQVTSSANEASTAAIDARHAIEEAQNQALEGGRVVQSAVEAMGAIEKSSSEIGQIVNLIDGIAFQTNLLALNAGVEAARAGDAGKGFAVVANEVRALAQRSADAAKSINDLISASGRQVENGVKLVGQTGELLTKIASQVTEASLQVAGIADNVRQQAQSMGQVNAAVSDLDRVTQQNAAMVEQASAATRSLASEALQLSRIVGRFAIRAGTAQSGASYGGASGYDQGYHYSSATHLAA